MCIFRHMESNSAFRRFYRWNFCETDNVTAGGVRWDGAMLQKNTSHRLFSQFLPANGSSERERCPISVYTLLSLGAVV